MSWTAHLKFILVYIEVICAYAWMEQVCASSVPGLLSLVYLIVRDYMQQFYSLKLYFIILTQSEERGKENQNFIIIPHDTLSSTDHHLHLIAASRS